MSKAKSETAISNYLQPCPIRGYSRYRIWRNDVKCFRRSIGNILSNQKINPSNTIFNIFGKQVRKYLPLLQTRIARILLVILLLATGALIITGRQGQSGAASPTEVGERLVTAIEESDILGVIDIMDPGERDLLRETFVDGAKELDRLGVIKKSSKSQSKILHYQIRNIAIREECISEDICNVFLTGNISGSLNRQSVLGDTFRNSTSFEDVETVQDLIYKLTNIKNTSVQQNFKNVMFTSIKRDGRWYASIGFTYAELIRGESQSLGNGPGLLPSGKETPEEAVDSLFRAIEIFDVRGIVQDLDPREFAPAQRYAELFVKSLQRTLQSRYSNSDFRWDITELKTEVIEKSSSSAQVRIKELSIQIKSWDWYYETETRTDIDITHSGGDIRLTIRTNDQTKTFQLTDLINDGINKSIVEPKFAEFVKYFLSITTYKRDGEWFVSPVSTISKTVLNMFKYLDQDDVRRLLDRSEFRNLLYRFT